MAKTGRVRDRVPPEVRHRTERAGLPDPTWYAGRSYEPPDHSPDDDQRRRDTAARSDQAIERRRRETRRQVAGFTNRMSAFLRERLAVLSHSIGLVGERRKTAARPPAQ